MVSYAHITNYLSITINLKDTKLLTHLKADKFSIVGREGSFLF